MAELNDPSRRPERDRGCVLSISIITVCRNAQSLLESTMRSVLTQTYGPIEYIIVDGQSSDHTVAVARHVANEFPERDVKIISEADQGISDAMNKGVLLASGTVITHLHAGDRYVGDTVIERVMYSFHRESWRWGVAGLIVVDINGRVVHVPRPRPRDYLRLLRRSFIPHQSSFVVRDIFVRHGLFRVGLKQAMDYEFWLRIAFKGGERYQVLPLITTYYLRGGYSSNLSELFRYMLVVRRELRTWVPTLTVFDDMLFFADLLTYIMYIALKRAISRLFYRDRRSS